MNADRAMIDQTLAVMLEPGQTTELRVPKYAGKKNRTVAGYFDDHQKLARAAAQASGNADGVYLTLNPVKPALLARAKNRTNDYADTLTTDPDIARRRWLLIDADPKRPAGISSTDAEHDAALERTAAIRAYLQDELGWPDGILADSGNGGHLLYRVDLPNSKEATELIETCLKALDHLFSDDTVEVDTTVGNAARISKVYGTLAAKGDNTEDRPHRLAKLLDVPDERIPVTEAQLRELAAQLPATSPVPPNLAERAQPQGHAKANGTHTTFDVAAWLQKHQIGVVRDEPWDGGHKWILETCPFSDAHTDGAFVGQKANGAIVASCRHNTCQGKKWPDLRARYENKPERKTQKPETVRPAGPGILSARELMAEQLPPVRWAVHGILPEGLSLLAGKPKMGKSWLALSLAIAQAAGGYALGSIKVEAGDALYLALEDNKRRLQTRMRKLLGDDPVPPRLSLATEWPRISEGGLEFLEQWLIAHPDARLVVIDTLAKIRPGRQRNGNLYDEDYAATEGLKALADRYQVAIVVVHHLRKAVADDPMDTISGSTGLTGGVDGWLILQRERGRADAVLHVTGRDLEEDQELALKWDGDLALWAIMGTAAEVRLSRERAAVLDAVRAGGAEGIGPKEVADVLGESYNVIKQRMFQMSNAGELRLVTRGRYVVGDAYTAPHTNHTNYHNLTNLANLTNLSDEPARTALPYAQKVSDDTPQPNLSPNLQIPLQSHETPKVSKVSKVSGEAAATPPTRLVGVPPGRRASAIAKLQAQQSPEVR